MSRFKFKDKPNQVSEETSNKESHNEKNLKGKLLRTVKKAVIVVGSPLVAAGIYKYVDTSVKKGTRNGQGIYDTHPIQPDQPGGTNYIYKGTDISLNDIVEANENLYENVSDDGYEILLQVLKSIPEQEKAGQNYNRINFLGNFVNDNKYNLLGMDAGWIKKGKSHGNHQITRDALGNYIGGSSDKEFRMQEVATKIANVKLIDPKTNKMEPLYKILGYGEDTGGLSKCISDIANNHIQLFEGEGAYNQAIAITLVSEMFKKNMEDIQSFYLGSGYITEENEIDPINNTYTTQMKKAFPNAKVNINKPLMEINQQNYIIGIIESGWPTSYTRGKITLQHQLLQNIKILGLNSAKTKYGDETLPSDASNLKISFPDGVLGESFNHNQSLLNERENSKELTESKADPGSIQQGVKELIKKGSEAITITDVSKKSEFIKQLLNVSFESIYASEHAIDAFLTGQDKGNLSNIKELIVNYQEALGKVDEEQSNKKAFHKIVSLLSSPGNFEELFGNNTWQDFVDSYLIPHIVGQNVISLETNNIIPVNQIFPTNPSDQFLKNKVNTLWRFGEGLKDGSDKQTGTKKIEKQEKVINGEYLDTVSDEKSNKEETIKPDKEETIKPDKEETIKPDKEVAYTVVREHIIKKGEIARDIVRGNPRIKGHIQKNHKSLKGGEIKDAKDIPEGIVMQYLANPKTKQQLKKTQDENNKTINPLNSLKAGEEILLIIPRKVIKIETKKSLGVNKETIQKNISLAIVDNKYIVVNGLSPNTGYTQGDIVLSIEEEIEARDNSEEENKPNNILTILEKGNKILPEPGSDDSGIVLLNNDNGDNNSWHCPIPGLRLGKNYKITVLSNKGEEIVSSLGCLSTAYNNTEKNNKTPDLFAILNNRLFPGDDIFENSDRLINVTVTDSNGRIVFKDELYDGGYDITTGGLGLGGLGKGLFEINFATEQGKHKIVTIEDKNIKGIKTT